MTTRRDEFGEFDDADLLYENTTYKESLEWDIAKRSCRRYALLEKFAAALEAECPDARNTYHRLYHLLNIV